MSTRTSSSPDTSPGLAAVPVPTPAQEPPTGGARPQVRPSFVQVIASALAAVTAAVLSGAFGVTGTFIGAAVASVVASVGSTLYLASLRNTHERLRRLAARQAWLAAQTGTARAAAATTEVPAEPSRWSRLRWSELRRGLPTLRRRWIAVGGLAVVVFALAIAVLSGIEASTNKPVSSLLGGQHGSGTSVGSVLDPKSTTPTPTPKPSVTPSATPSATTSPSPSVAPSPSASASASPSPAPSSSASPSESPAPSPSGAPSPGASATLATAP